MARLIAFGDSMTYGVGLEDCWPVTKNPSRYCWPELVASALGRSCVNKSVPGSSNKRIWFHISKFKFRPDDLVLILWTYPDRTAVLRNPFSLVNLLPSQVENSQGDEQAMARGYYENLHTYYDSDVMSSLFIRDATAILKKQNITFHQMIAEPRDKKLFDDIDYVPLYMGNYERNFNKALDNDHAGPDGHIAFARDLLDHIGVESSILRPRPLSVFRKILRKCR